MREITDINEIKKILEQILINVVDFCEKNQLKYYLGFGTLLGAVRHNGFIPWDDDVDIIMPREDYEKFVDAYSSDKYKIIDLRTDEKYFYPFAKVYDTSTVIQENTAEHSDFGLFIDVFPLDGVPETNKFHLHRLVLLQKLLMSKYKGADVKKTGIKRFFMAAARLLLKPVKSHNLACLIDRLASKYRYDKYDNVALVVWGYYYLVYKKSDIEPGTMHRFESFVYNVPGNYDAVLKATYGDYMQLPPPEKRVSKHGYRAYYIDRD